MPAMPPAEDRCCCFRRVVVRARVEPRLRGAPVLKAGYGVRRPGTLPIGRSKGSCAERPADTLYANRSLVAAACVALTEKRPPPSKRSPRS